MTDTEKLLADLKHHAEAFEKGVTFTDVLAMSTVKVLRQAAEFIEKRYSEPEIIEITGEEVVEICEHTSSCSRCELNKSDICKKVMQDMHEGIPANIKSILAKAYMSGGKE